VKIKRKKDWASKKEHRCGGLTGWTWVGLDRFGSMENRTGSRDIYICCGRFFFI